MKDVILWTADAWNTINFSHLRKARYPLLNVTYEDPTQNISSEDENSSLEKFF